MKATLTTLALFTALAAGACGSARGSGAAAGDSAKTGCAMCARGQSGEAVWCEHCKAGFVGGEKVRCAGCFAAKTGGAACPHCTAR